MRAVLDADDVVCVCKRVIDMGAEPIAGSIEQPCQSCALPIIVSPVSQELIAAGTFTAVVCVDCFLEQCEILAAALTPPPTGVVTS